MNDERRGLGEPGMAFVLGLAVGAVSALLLAPAPGQETRRRVREFTQRMGSRVRDGLHNAKAGASEARNRLEHAIHAGREAYRQGTDPSAGTETFGKEGRSGDYGPDRP